MKTNITILLIAATCFLAIEAKSQVIFEKVDSHVPFTEIISEIELVPLDTDTVNMLRTEIWCKHGFCPVPEVPIHSIGPEIIVTEDAFILPDPGQDRIYRYSLDGKFMNSIGSTENEDQMTLNTQLYDGEIHVFYTLPDVAACYRTDGTLISSEKIEDAGFEGWMTKEAGCHGTDTEAEGPEESDYGRTMTPLHFSRPMQKSFILILMSRYSPGPERTCCLLTEPEAR